MGMMVGGIGVEEFDSHCIVIVFPLLPKESIGQGFGGCSSGIAWTQQGEIHANRSGDSLNADVPMDFFWRLLNRNIWQPRTNFECFEIEKNGHVREAVRSFGPHFRVCGPGAKRLVALLQF